MCGRDGMEWAGGSGKGEALAVHVSHKKIL